MTVKQIKNLVDKHFNLNIDYRRSTKKYTTPRFIYYVLARKYAEDKRTTKIGKAIGFTHGSVIHCGRQLDGLFIEYPSYKLSYDHLEKIIKGKLKIKDEVKVEIKYIESKPLRYSIDCIVTDLKDVSDSDILNFTQTRLKPYLSMLKSRKVHNIKHVAGALLR